MPIREYRCPQCNTEIELIELSETDKRGHHCPYDDVLMERIVSVTATPRCKGEGCYKRAS